MLDNREISILACLAVLSLWANANVRIRKAAVNVVRAALAWKLLLLISLVAAYVGLVVHFLRGLGLWDFTNLKTTILWFFSAGLVMVSEVVSTQDDDRYFQKAVLDGLKLSTLLEFIVNFYVLSLPFELVLVPTTALLACMLVVAEYKEEYRSARTLLSTVLALLGFGLLTYCVYQFYSDVEAFARASTLAEFLLPFVLTIIFVPCLYLVATYVSYENLFVRLRFFMKDPRLRRFTKIQLLLRFNLNFRGLNRWGRGLTGEWPETKKAVLASIRGPCAGG